MASASKTRTARPATNALNGRLVEATLELLRGETPTDLTVRRIATAAGTTTMALYTGFGSRDGLLDVVYAEGFEQLYARMAPSARLTDPAEALVALLGAYRGFALDNPGLYGLLFERVLPGFDPNPEARSAALDNTFGLLVTQSARQLGTDAQAAASRKLAYALWALTHGLVSLELSHAGRTPLPHPALSDTAGDEVLERALRATLAGWSESAQA